MSNKFRTEFFEAVNSLPDKVIELYDEIHLYYIHSEQLENNLREHIFELLKCESPIEQILLLGLYFFSDRFWIGYKFEPQKTIVVGDKTYRADIYFSSENFGMEKPYKLIIECDGHNFHEITKEQVENRNNRDFELKRAGYDVLHFSGSQIYNKPRSYSSKIGYYIMEKVVERLNGNI